jgi:hypothetical protein
LNGFELVFTAKADRDFTEIENNPSLYAELKAVRKCLAWLENSPRHPSLQTHKINSLRGPEGEQIFEAYAQNQTPGAYRIFWYYGSERHEIIIAAIVLAIAA